METNYQEITIRIVEINKRIKSCHICSFHLQHSAHLIINVNDSSSSLGQFNVAAQSSSGQSYIQISTRIVTRHYYYWTLSRPAIRTTINENRKSEVIFQQALSKKLTESIRVHEFEMLLQIMYKHYVVDTQLCIANCSNNKMSTAGKQTHKSRTMFL